MRAFILPFLMAACIAEPTAAQLAHFPMPARPLAGELAVKATLLEAAGGVPLEVARPWYTEGGLGRSRTYPAPEGV